MGIKALYPKLNMPIGIKEHYKYSYLLKEFRNDKGQVIIQKVNQVYLTDMNTYNQDKMKFIFKVSIILSLKAMKSCEYWNNFKYK